MKTMLVTGGAGFIGSHVVDRLLLAGHRVVVADNLSTGLRSNVAQSAEFHCVDIVQPEFQDLVESVRPDAIFHLAAQVSVAASVEDPSFDATVNVLGTLNVLESARKFGARYLVFSSSAAVYGVPSCLPLTEDAPIQPLSPYGVAKVAGERYIASYCDLHGLQATSLRYANVYGPRQLPGGDGGVIAKFVERLVSGQSPVFEGDGEQTRDFVFVNDVAEANYLAFQYMARAVGPICATFNISTGDRVSLVELYSTMASVFPSAPQPVHVGARSGDIRHSCLDNRKAYSFLGWSPRVSLRQGLHETISASSIMMRGMVG